MIIYNSNFLLTKALAAILVIFISFISLAYGSNVSNTNTTKSNNTASNNSNAADNTQGNKLQNLDDKDVIVTDAWARPSLSSLNSTSAVYLTLQNKTTSDIVLIAATAMDIANNTELHQTVVNDQGVAHMVHVDKLNVPGGNIIAFKPGGIHIMLTNLKKNLKVGDTFNLSLLFEGYEPKVISVTVQK